MEYQYLKYNKYIVFKPKHDIYNSVQKKLLLKYPEFVNFARFGFTIKSSY